MSKSPQLVLKKSSVDSKEGIVGGADCVLWKLVSFSFSNPPKVIECSSIEKHLNLI